MAEVSTAVLHTVVATIFDIFGGSDVVPYTPEEIAAQLEDYIRNLPDDSEELAILEDPVLLNEVIQNLGLEGILDNLGLPHDPNMATSVPPVNSGEPTGPSTETQLRDAGVADTGTGNLIDDIAADPRTTVLGPDGNVKQQGYVENPQGAGHIPVGTATTGSPNQGQTQQTGQQQSGNEGWIAGLLGLLGSLFGGLFRGSDDGSGGILSGFGDIFGQALGGAAGTGLNNWLFGDDADRALDFFDRVFPDTNQFDRLGGNTGVGQIAGQTMQERMQIRELANRKEIAHIQNIPQLHRSRIENIDSQTALNRIEEQYRPRMLEAGITAALTNNIFSTLENMGSQKLMSGQGWNSLLELIPEIKNLGQDQQTIIQESVQDFVGPIPPDTFGLELPSEPGYSDDILSEERSLTGEDFVESTGRPAGRPRRDQWRRDGRTFTN